MAIFAVIMSNYSEAFDKNFLERMGHLGPEVEVVNVTSEGEIKVYCLRLQESFANMNGDYFLDEFFKFDKDILAISFLRKEEGWVYE